MSLNHHTNHTLPYHCHMPAFQVLLVTIKRNFDLHVRPALNIEIFGLTPLKNEHIDTKYII